MHKNQKKPLVIAISLASAMAASAAVGAAEVKLEEVVVTAQKREQNLQETPVAIAAFDAEALKSQGISDVEDVSNFVPNVQISESPGGSTGATASIRGSVSVNPAVTWEPTVGVYMDGVFIAKNVGGIFDVAELERVEVLRGPQGSLYGKNTVGGAINLVTRKPSGEFGGNVRVGAGNYGYTDVFASVDTPEISGLSANLAVNQKQRDGFYKNTAGGDAAERFKEVDSTAGRFAALYTPMDALDVRYSYDWAKKDNTPGFGQFDAEGSAINRRDEGALNGAIEDDSEVEGHAVHISYALNEMLTLKSITAHREMSFDDTNDYDGSGFLGFHAQRHVDQDQDSQEFQLLGKTDVVDFVAGVFYFKEDADAVNPYFFPVEEGVGRTDNFYGVEATSQAVYGQVDYHVTPQLTLTGGLRWTEEEKDFYIEHLFGAFELLPYTEANDTWTNTSPMAVVTYQWTDDVSTYAKVAKGWKAGGFNGEAADVEVAQTPYDPEKITAYELGVKSRFLEDRVQTNAALFHNKLTDMQLSHFLGESGYSEIRNAGEATVNGLELEVLAAVADGFNLSLNYGHLDPEYKKFDVPGFSKDTAEFPYSPDDKVSVGLDFLTPTEVGDLSTRIDWTYVSEYAVYHDPASAALTMVNAHHLVNGRLALSNIDVGAGDNRLTFALWGKNLLNEEYRINGIPFVDVPVLGSYGINYYGDPRTVGIDATYEF